MKNTTVLKVVVCIAIAGALIAVFWDEANFAYFKWRLENNAFSDDKHIYELADAARQFEAKIVIPLIIDRINPEINKGMPGRRIAQGAMIVLLEGDYEEEELIDFEHALSEAVNAHEEWQVWWEGAEATLRWDSARKYLIFDD